jgi:hypothetical protein
MFQGAALLFAVALTTSGAQAGGEDDPVQNFVGEWSRPGDTKTFRIEKNHTTFDSYLGEGDIQWINADRYVVNYPERRLACHYKIKLYSATELSMATVERTDPMECNLGVLRRAASAAPSQPKPLTRPEDIETAAAQAWSVVQNTTSEAVLEEYMRRYPETAYAGFAKARINELRQNKAMRPEKASEEESSFWMHNGSLVLMIGNGASRRVVYQRPRPGMVKEGVMQGTLLFIGTVAGTAYSGTAYIFSGRCEASYPYRVDGGMSADGRQLSLHGKAPANIDSDCEVTSYRDDYLIFTRSN